MVNSDFGANLLMSAAAIWFFVASASTEHVQTLQNKYRSSLPYHRNSKGCEYRGVRYAAGASVPTEESCLRCRCVRGTLVCYLRVCPALPDPPPPGCILHLRNGNCCAELKCQDEYESGVVESGLSRMEPTGDDGGEITIAHEGGCVHSGTLYAPGSAMATSSACEQCFCIGGAERCIRPSCMPAPAGCTPRPPPPSLCCPLHYDCATSPSTTLAPVANQGCSAEGRWFPEGERVEGISTSRCDNCFCIRGLIRCMPLACAPTLFGCKPIIRKGDCCASGYDCESLHNLHVRVVTDDSLTSPMIEDRSFRDRGSQPTTTLKYSKIKKEKRPTTILNNISLKKYESAIRQSIKQSRSPTPKTISTTFDAERANITKDIPNNSRIADKIMPIIVNQAAINVLINGSINCTTNEYVSQIKLDPDIEKHNNENLNIDRFDGKDYDEYDSEGIVVQERNSPHRILDNTFMVNVSTQLSTNGTSATSSPNGAISTDNKNLLNFSKNEEYDYDYLEATLPPSLPNLKIIPFVAADAVMGEENATSEISISDKLQTHNHHQKVPHNNDAINNRKFSQDMSSVLADLARYNENFTENNKRHNMGNLNNEEKNTKANPLKLNSTDTFIPPISTEGGFVPKETDEFTQIDLERPTTSTSIKSPTGEKYNDLNKCTADDGRIFENGAVMMKSTDCSRCICIFGQLQCHIPACPSIEAGCIRVPSSTDPCCGIVICENELTITKLKTSHAPSLETTPSIEKTTLKPHNEETNKPEAKIPPFKALPISKNESEQNFGYKNIQSEEENFNSSNINNDYNEEDEDDDDFSFGNVLKLLLSEAYDSTTKRTTVPPVTSVIYHTTELTTSRTTDSPKPTDASTTKTNVQIISMQVPTTKPPITIPPATTTKSIYATQKNNHSRNNTTTANRNRTRPNMTSPHFHDTLPERILYNSFISSNIHSVTESVTKSSNSYITVTSKSLPTNKPLSFELTKIKSKLPPLFKEDSTKSAKPVNNNKNLLRPAVDIGTPKIEENLIPKNNPIVYEGSKTTTKPNKPITSSLGLLKLAGCNIYGVMYKAGKLIDELSNPCLECMCTENGVLCRPTC